MKSGEASNRLGELWLSSWWRDIGSPIGHERGGSQGLAGTHGDSPGLTSLCCDHQVKVKLFPVNKEV